MPRRLVLGCSPVGHAVIDRLSERPGDLSALTRDTGRVTTLRDAGVTAREADPTDPRNFPEQADLVVVAGTDPDQNLAAARAARAAYPDATLIAFAGAEPGAPVDNAEAVEAVETADRGVEGKREGQRGENRSVVPDRTHTRGHGEAGTTAAAAALTAVADHVIDPTAAIAERVLDAAGGPAGRRAAGLLSTLRDTEPPLAVVAHNNPDPDAIASALALAELAESVGLAAEPCHYGSVSHQENRAFVNLLDISMASLEGADLDAYGGIALVDHSRPGINDSLPPDTPVDVVIDHHPPGGPVEGRFVDVRPDAGATSSMLVGYLRRLGGDGSGDGNAGIDDRLATALLYGIRVDTREFTREVSPLDFAAAGRLVPRADWDLLDRIGSPSMNPETLETIGRAISRRDVHGSALSACVGEIRDRDALAQAADLLLGMEGVRITLVYGYVDGVIYCSARARGADVDLGEVLRRALDRIGSAGGHADMAGAQVPLGILEDIDRGDERLADVVRDVISARFHAALADAPSVPAFDPAELTQVSGPSDSDTGPGDAGADTAGDNEKWGPSGAGMGRDEGGAENGDDSASSEEETRDVSGS